MKRWVIAGVALLAVAVGLTVWLLTRSDDTASSNTPEDAVLSVCHADAGSPPRDVSRLPGLNGSTTPGADFAVIAWVAPGRRTGYTALVKRTAGGTWRVSKCNWTFPLVGG